MGKKVSRMEKTVDLGEGLAVRYTVERVGQLPPHEGDAVEVEGRLYLPGEVDAAGSGLVFLLREIQFSVRLTVLGESLNKSWGSQAGCREGESPHERYRSFRTSAARWAAAFRKAEKRCIGYIADIERTVDERRQALIDAELDDEGEGQS